MRCFNCIQVVKNQQINWREIRKLKLTFKASFMKKILSICDFLCTLESIPYFGRTILPGKYLKPLCLKCGSEKSPFEGLVRPHSSTSPSVMRIWTPFALQGKMPNGEEELNVRAKQRIAIGPKFSEFTLSIYCWNLSSVLTRFLCAHKAISFFSPKKPLLLLFKIVSYIYPFLVPSLDG